METTARCSRKGKLDADVSLRAILDQLSGDPHPNWG
jgi:hypothetical protein